MSGDTCTRYRTASNRTDDVCDCTACQLRRLVSDLTAEVAKLREELANVKNRNERNHREED